MPASIYSCRIGILLACLICGTVLGAQQPASIQSKDGVYTLHADTHLVLLDVTVTDNHGHPVSGLTKDDFKLQEDGQPQTIKFFEEHAPVDPAEIARQKAAALAGQPPNTFTNYEPFSGRPVTVLLLNELYPLTMSLALLHQRMLDTVQNVPPDTPFAVYLLDSELRLMQPVTTDRALVLARINEIWKTPHFGSEKLINPTEYAAHPDRYKAPSSGESVDDLPTQITAPRVPRAEIGYSFPPAEDIPVRRRITSDAMRQLASSLKGVPGRKDLFAFTGAFQCSVVGGVSVLCPEIPFPNDSKNYLCGLMDSARAGADVDLSLLLGWRNRIWLWMPLFG